MNSSLSLDPRPLWVDAASSWLLRPHWLGRLLSMPAPTVPEASVELLRLAEQYEASQPSYAADLRAAALQSMGSRID